MSPGLSLSLLSCLSLLAALQLVSAGGTPAGAERAARFLSPWALPALPGTGRAPSSWQPGHAGSLAGGCRKKLRHGEKEKHLDMKGLAVTSWPGLVLCWAGTVQAPMCLLLPRSVFWIRSVLDLLLVPAEAGESQ